MTQQPAFGGPQRDANGLLRSISCPALAKKRQTATQNMLRAIPNNNVTALRGLALQAGAELTGVRAYDLTGRNPEMLVQACEHFVPHEKNAFRKQFRELPHLVRSADHARTQANTVAFDNRSKSATALPARGKSNGASMEATLMIAEDDSSTDTGGERTIKPTSMTAQGGTKAVHFSPASTKTLRGREMQAKSAMTSLSSTVGHAETASKAVFKNPKLLTKDVDAVASAFPAMCSTLRSQEVALRAATKNPRLMHVDGTKFKKVVPVLNVILGSEEEAAYCIATRPEVLEVERGQQLKDTVQMVADAMCSMSDAVWLVVQTFVPPSIRLTTLPFHHEALQGEYIRLKGVRFDERPVYRKPASTMVKQFGPKARDMFLLYSNHGPDGEACWTITPAFDAAKGSRPSKAKTEADYACEVIGKAATCRNSPDQVAVGSWQFQQFETKSTTAKEGWHNDMYVKTSDGGRRRGPPLLVSPPALIRRSYDILQEALGVFWRKADSNGVPFPGARFVGYYRKGDRIHSGEPGKVGTVTIQETGDFNLKKGFTAVRLPASGVIDELKLQAWEPMLVYLLYVSDLVVEEEKEEEPGGESAPPAKGGKKDPKADAAALAEAEAAAAAAEKGARSYRARLEKDGWWKLPDKSVKVPELRKEVDGVPVQAEVKEVFARCYHKGACVIPAPAGDHGPPLVFTRPCVTAISKREMAPCQNVKAKPHESIYFVKEEKKPTAEETAEEPPPAKGGKKGAPPPEAAAEEAEPTPAGPSQPVLKGVGDLGYAGYELFRAPPMDRHCDPEQTQLRIETDDRIKVVLAWCRLPPPKLQKTEASEDAPPTSGEAGEESSPVPALAEPTPPLPPWVDRDGWKVYEPKLPITLIAESGDVIEIDRYRIKEFNRCAINIKGSGPDLTCLVFYVHTGPPRPDHLRNLLYHEPGLLSAADHLTYLWRQLRVELGEDCARMALMNPDLTQEWAFLCQAGTEDELEEWIYKRKLEAFGSQLGGLGRGGLEKAKALIERQPQLADVSAPLLTTRVRSLTQGLGSIGSMLDVVTRMPELLAGDAGLFPRSLEVLQKVFGLDNSQDLASEHPELLTRGAQMEALFARAEEQFPQIYIQRLRERNTGEWALWRRFVDETPGVVSKWLGRIAAEERELTCQDRMKAFGTQVATSDLVAAAAGD